jgi:hypothetical protein
MLRGNPLAINVAWEMGQLCREQGLFPTAMVMYEYARSVAESTGQIPSVKFQRDYLNALLDAGLDERAVAEFADQVKHDPPDVAIASLLVEAYIRLGNTEAAKDLVTRMLPVYRAEEASSAVKSSSLGELAWFHYHFRGRQQVAMQWARMGMSRAGDDPLLRRVWGMLFLGSVKPEEATEARQILEELSGTDPYALAALIDDAYTRSDTAAAEKLLAKAADLSRKGPAWRYLAAVAVKWKAQLPGLTQQARDIEKMVNDLLAGGSLEPGRHPEKFLRITVEPVQAEFSVGDPLAVRATLTNIGEMPVPLGEWGLLSPKMMLVVKAEAEEGRAQADNRSAVIWPAPRYLQINVKVFPVVG